MDPDPSSSLRGRTVGGAALKRQIQFQLRAGFLLAGRGQHEIDVALGQASRAPAYCQARISIGPRPCAGGVTQRA